MTDAAVPARITTLPLRLWRAYLPLAALWAIYHGASLTVLERVGSPAQYDFANFIPSFLPALPFFLIGVVFFVYFRLFVFRGDMTARLRLRAWLTETRWVEAILLRFLPGMLFIFLIQRVYLGVKHSIPQIRPFDWDLTFAAWDRALLFGHDAWELTHAVFGSVTATSAIDQLYILWIYVLFAGVFVAVLQPLDDRRRMAYLTATGLSWGIGGSLMAVAFSSAGPVFVEPLLGDPLYAPLVDRLHRIDAQQNLAALDIMDRLWKGYAGIDGVQPLGISAFPSMHLCMATLNAAYAFRFGRAWGWVATAFTAAMLIGSVHLGWHYLVDGLAGIALALLFWTLGARFAAWWLPATAR